MREEIKIKLSLKEDAPADLVLAYFCGQPIPNHTFLRGLEHLINAVINQERNEGKTDKGNKNRQHDHKD